MVSMLSCVEDSVVFERYMHEMAYLFKQNLLYKQVRKLVPPPIPIGSLRWDG